MCNIAGIEIYRYSIPLRAPVTIAIGTITEAQNILVKIISSDGEYGWGEGAPFRMIVGETQDTCIAVAQDFARLILGRSVTDISGNLKILNQYITGNTTVKSAFDMALYDLTAKIAGMPLYRFLGGQRKEIITDETIYLGSAEGMASDAVEVMRRGADAIKVKLGTSVSEDVQRIRAIRSAVGSGVPIRIDANQGWSVQSAIEVLRELSPLGIQYCEQPVKHWDIEGLTYLKLHSSIPVCADEALFTAADAIRLVRANAVDYFNIKLSKSGGIQSALQINSIAEAAGIPCMIGCMSESRLAISANAHLASALDNIIFYDLDSPFEHAADPVSGGVVYQDHYRLEIPETPGHGADIDPEFLKDLQTWRLVL